MDDRVALAVVPPERDGRVVGSVGQVLLPLIVAEGADLEWALAFETWLETKSKNTRRAYLWAWRDLRSFTGMRPWELLSADVQRWEQDLRRRMPDLTRVKAHSRRGLLAQGRETGLSPSSISVCLAAVSSFYRYVSSRYMVRTSEGSERPLHTYNPALTVRRPNVPQFADLDYLSPKELSALLVKIPQLTAAGKRDYALLLGYVLTGRRNGEWRELRWGDLRARGDKIWYTWSGKNTASARNEVPPPVWEAILAYLEATGRALSMQAGDYVFTPLIDSATKFANVDTAGWRRNRPLSPGAVNRLLRKYARSAGLDPQRVHVHILRHSAAMLEAEAGAGLVEISQFLGHSNPKTTMRYLNHLCGRGDSTWQQKVALLELAKPEADVPTGQKDAA